MNWNATDEIEHGIAPDGFGCLDELKSSYPVYTPSQSRASTEKGSSDCGLSQYCERPKNRVFQANKDFRSSDRRRTGKRHRHAERWSRPGDPGCKGSISSL